MGVLATKKSLVQCDKLATASFCRRRLAVVMVRLKMAETMREAVTFVEQVSNGTCVNRFLLVSSSSNVQWCLTYTMSHRQAINDAMAMPWPRLLAAVTALKSV